MSSKNIQNKRTSSLATRELGLYIHIPFCVRKCAYCDFCSFPVSRDVKKYVEKLVRQIRLASHLCREHKVVTVYFGGGTPSLLSKEDIGIILRTIKESYELDENAEITVECNPGTLDRQKLYALRSLGINRLSIGAQSLVDSELKLLGRIHDSKEFVSTVALAREAGFDNISGDLMYGIPDQTMESLRYSASEMCALGLEHISLYALSIEMGTVFYKTCESLRLPSEDTVADMYSEIEKILTSYGYEKYEISNYSKSGYHSRHNTGYWEGREYLGFGIAAHSYFGGMRFAAKRDMRAYLSSSLFEKERFGENADLISEYISSDIFEEREKIDGDEEISEYVMLHMRLAKGISFEEFFGRFSIDFYDFIDISREEIAKYVEGGFLSVENGRIFFTSKGFFVSNAILSEMIGF